MVGRDFCYCFSFTVHEYLLLKSFAGGKSLRELRQLYFRIKDEIFAKGRYGFGWDSDAYEEILQQYLDPKIKLMDVTHPR